MSANLRVFGLRDAAEATNPYGPALIHVKAILSPAAVAAGPATSEQAITVTGLKAGDVILSINKPTTQTTLGVLQARVSAANTMQLTFVNTATTSQTPTASETYDIVIFRPAT